MHCFNFPLSAKQWILCPGIIAVKYSDLVMIYRIAQNFGGINFWQLVARHAIGGEKFGESSTTGLSRIVHMVTFKNLEGKTLAGIRKSAKIFHCQNFALYGNQS